MLHLKSISSMFYTCVFVQKIGAKNSKPKSRQKKGAQRLLYEKGVRKTLMKLTPGYKLERKFDFFLQINLKTIRMKFSESLVWFHWGRYLWSHKRLSFVIYLKNFKNLCNLISFLVKRKQNSFISFITTQQKLHNL